MIHFRVLLLGLLAPGLGAAWPCHNVEQDSRLDALFRQARVEGVVVVWEAGAPACLSSDPDRATQREIPASTFKIPHSLVLLETAVVSDIEVEEPWDGVDRGYAFWNRPHSLRTALRDSAVWFYQRMARRVGHARMEGWLRRLDYGNGHITGGLDRFWLDGGLRISPLEQVAFLHRLWRSELPASEANQALVRDILIRERGNGYLIRAKTGWAMHREPQVGWYVGWLEADEKTWFFATLVDIVEPDHRKLRIALSHGALALAGAPIAVPD